MEVKLNICKLGGEKSCAIRISDATTDFLPEDSSTPVFQKFKMSEVKSIDVVRFNTINETKILRVFISDIDLSNIFEIKEDGWYDVHHIVLPTKEWFDQALEDGGMIYTYDTVYYIDNEKFYKYKNSVTTEICIEEILERNPLNTTISVACQNHFSIFYLMHCYILLAEKLLSINLRCENNQLSELTFNRDVLWMAINIIKYSVEFGDLEGATVRLSKLNYCNGLCKKLNNDTLNISGCGCSK